jgi:hypothetical protein
MLDVLEVDGKIICETERANKSLILYYNILLNFPLSVLISSIATIY